MSVGWKRYCLGDVTEMQYGKMPKKDLLTDTGYQIFTGYRVAGYYKKKMFSDEQVIVIARGVGGTGDVKLSPPNSWITNLSIILKFKEDLFDKSFVKYKLNNCNLRSLDSGSAQSQITIQDLQRFSFDAPSLEVQQQISRFLNNYENLISINKRRIKILEEMAQLIYTEWFVNFRFPGHEKIKLVDSKTDFGEIPDGWDVVKVESLLSKVSRFKKIKKQDYQEEGRIPVIDQGRSFIGGYTSDSESEYEFSDAACIIFGDHTRILKFINFNFACGADGTQILISNSKRMPQTLFFQSLMNIDLSNYAYARHFKFLKAEKIILPNEDIAKDYDKVSVPMYSLITKLQEKNRALSKMRDLLIPKLVTGEVKIKA